MEATVAHQRAGVNPKSGLLAGFAQRLPESLPVPVVSENLLPMTAPGHHMIHRGGTLDANRLGHTLGRLRPRNPVGQAQYVSPICHFSSTASLSNCRPALSGEAQRRFARPILLIGVSVIGENGGARVCWSLLDKARSCSELQNHLLSRSRVRGRCSTLRRTNLQSRTPGRILGRRDSENE